MSGKPGQGKKRRECPRCQARVGARAAFCDQCGSPVATPATAVAAATMPSTASAARPSALPDEDDDRTAAFLAEFDSRPEQKLAHELFEAHLELLRNYRKRTKELAHEIDRTEQELGKQTAAPISAARTQAIQAVLESLERLGDRWEDLQLSYNRDSEGLEEEYLDRFAELELDVELPEELEGKMVREVEVVSRTLDRLEERIRSLGTLGNGLIARAEGRWFASAPTRGGRWFELLLWGAAFAGVHAMSRYLTGTDWKQALYVALPVVLAWLFGVLNRLWRR